MSRDPKNHDGPWQKVSRLILPRLIGRDRMVELGRYGPGRITRVSLENSAVLRMQQTAQQVAGIVGAIGAADIEPFHATTGHATLGVAHHLIDRGSSHCTRPNEPSTSKSVYVKLLIAPPFTRRQVYFCGNAGEFLLIESPNSSGSRLRDRRLLICGYPVEH